MINIIGNIFGSSGYSIHTRELASALNKITDISLTTTLVHGWERIVTDEELKMIKKIPNNEINLIITNPLNWKIHTEAKRNWVYLVWEGDKIPECFIEECSNPKIEYIFVPSQHTQQAIINTLATDDITKAPNWINKIKIMPHGVDLKKFYQIEKDL